MAGDPEFFAITKRIHNRLHGAAGDAGELGAGRGRSTTPDVTTANASWA